MAESLVMLLIWCALRFGWLEAPPAEAPPVPPSVLVTRGGSGVDRGPHKAENPVRLRAALPFHAADLPADRGVPHAGE